MEKRLIERILTIAIFGILVLFISVVPTLAILVEPNPHLPLTTAGGATALTTGMKILVLNNPIVIKGVSKNESDGTTRALILNASKDIIAYSAFSGNNATFDYLLQNNTIYYIAADCSGTSCGPRAYRPITLSYPVAGTVLNWTNGLSAGVDEASASTITFLDIQYPISIVLNAPSDGTGTIENSTFFNASLSTLTGQNLTNATIYIYNSTGDIFNKTTNLITGNLLNTTTWNITNFVLGSYTWGIEGCIANASTTSCVFSENRSFDYGYRINSQVYNSTSYETSFERFALNLTVLDSISSPTAKFYYGGSLVDTVMGIATGEDYIFKSSKDIPLGEANNSFNWITTLNGNSFNLSSNTQYVNITNLSVCGSAPQNVPYINFTFKDEVSGADINGSLASSSWDYWLGRGTIYKSLTYSNTTDSDSYSFCFSPPSKQLSQDTLLQYQSTGYPQRRLIITSNLTNSTTNQVLYLVSSSDGIYSTIQVVNVVGNPIVGVNLVLETQIGGIWTVVGNDDTDGAGGVTFWVDPNSDYRITATKNGYLSSQQTVRLTQTIYTLTLSTASANATYTSDLEGLTWIFRPGVGIVQNNTSTSFNVTINATKGNLEGCIFKLTNQTSNISQTTDTCTSYGGFLSLTYTPQASEKIRGVLQVDLGDGYITLDGDAYWVGYNANISQARTLKGILGSLAQLNEFGDGVEQEFSRIVFFFFILTIALGIVTFFTGYDFSNPGFTMILLYGLILFASLSGWFYYDGLVSTSALAPTSEIRTFLNQYSFLIITSFLFLGWLMNRWGKIAE